jgi:hypothetical protein
MSYFSPKVEITQTFLGMFEDSANSTAVISYTPTLPHHQSKKLAHYDLQAF